mgnify:FL=1
MITTILLLLLLPRRVKHVNISYTIYMEEELTIYYRSLRGVCRGVTQPATQGKTVQTRTQWSSPQEASFHIDVIVSVPSTQLSLLQSRHHRNRRTAAP